MKRISPSLLLLCLAVIGVGTAYRPSVDAATSGGHVFLKGDYIEVGIHPAGSFGTAVTAPAGFVYGGRTLGIIADYGRDGWSAGGPPYSGDYFLPGEPVESWGVEWTTAGGAEHTFNNGGLLGRIDVPSTGLTETSTGAVQSAVWEGTALAPGGEELRITQTIRFGTGDLHMVMETVVTNVGSTRLDSVEFMRNIDADPEQPWTGIFATENYVVEDGDRKLAVARGRTYHGVTLGIGTVDSRAAVTFGGFDNTDPDWVWDQAALVNANYDEAHPRVSDEALALAYRLGSLEPGQSTSFEYAYIFSNAEFESVLNGLTPPVTILSPGNASITGGAVPLRATTADVANTARVDFYVDGTFVGGSSTPDADGVFEVFFNSWPYPDGTITLEAVATFNDGSTARRVASPFVNHAGGAMAFVAPSAGQVFSPGETIAVEVAQVAGPDPISHVTFYRESASGGSIWLGEDTAPPFTSSFDVNDLPPGEIVTIKAVADDGTTESAAYVAGSVRAGASFLQDVFLKGAFVEAGVHRWGSFGTAAPAPAGFVNHGQRLGFVADYGQDGWTAGVPPFAGDYFVPGNPVEGWAVEWTSANGNEQNFKNAGLMDDHGVRATSLTNTSTADTQSAVWEGLAIGPAGEQLKVSQTIRFRNDDAYMVMSTVMTNVGSKRLEAVEFMRNVDPDQEQPWTGRFETMNYVVEGADRKLAVARGRTYSQLMLGLGTMDSRAVATMGGFDNADPDWVWDRAAAFNHFYDAAHPHLGDEAIMLAYRFGNLAPGQSVKFDYAYILNEADLDEALEEVAAVTILQPGETVSGSDVRFQVTTDEVPYTTRVDFLVNGAPIGSDASPDENGAFDVSFDSLAYANGPIDLKAVATYADGRTAERSGTTTIANPGPPIAFVAPVPGQLFVPGVSTVAAVEALDGSNPPSRVTFTLESPSAGSIALGEVTAAPFAVSFDVAGLPEGETVVVTATAFGVLDRSTTVQVSGTVTLMQDQAITFDALPDRTYGDGDFTVSAVASSGLPVSLSIAGGCTLAGDVIGITGAGSCTVMASQVGDAHYNPAPDVIHTFTIAKAALTVAADNATRQYGSDNPELAASYSGFVNGDTAAVLTGAPATMTDATADAAVGSYPITVAPGTLTAANYAFTFVNGTLTITSRAVTVTAGTVTKVYGDSDPGLSYAVTSGTLAVGDSFAGALDRVPGGNVGTYAIGQGTLALSGNYALTFVSANLSVTPRGVAVAADSLGKGFGTADPPLTFRITSGSVVAGDGFSGALARIPGEDVGTYPIGQGTLTLGTNYALVVAGATLTIAPHAVTVSADAQTKILGAPDPPLTYQVTAGGLVPWEAFTGALSREPGEEVGTYAILQGTLALDSNYAATYQGASLTIRYGTCFLYDTTRAHRSGSTIPIMLRLCDASGRVAGHRRIRLRATGVYNAATNTPVELEDAGHANPGRYFRRIGLWSAYLFNLKTDRELPAGDYYLTFTIGDDPQVYTAPFRIADRRWHGPWGDGSWPGDRDDSPDWWDGDWWSGDRGHGDRDDRSGSWGDWGRGDRDDRPGWWSDDRGRDDRDNDRGSNGRDSDRDSNGRDGKRGSKGRG